MLSIPCPPRMAFFFHQEYYSLFTKEQILNSYILIKLCTQGLVTLTQRYSHMGETLNQFVRISLLVVSHFSYGLGSATWYLFVGYCLFYVWHCSLVFVNFWFIGFMGVFSKCQCLDLNWRAPSQTQDNHFETKSLTTWPIPLGYAPL